MIKVWIYWDQPSQTTGKYYMSEVHMFNSESILDVEGGLI